MSINISSTAQSNVILEKTHVNARYNINVHACIAISWHACERVRGDTIFASARMKVLLMHMY